MKKTILLILLVGGLILAGVYFYIQRDSRNDIRFAKPDVELSSEALYASYETDEEKANSQYLGKTLLIHGNLEDITSEGDQVTITLQSDSPLNSIVCEMNTNLDADFANLRKNQEITVKGICSGKLMDIILVNCIIQE